MTVVSYPAGSFIPCCLSTPTCSTINERFNRKAIKCIITLLLLLRQGQGAARRAPPLGPAGPRRPVCRGRRRLPLHPPQGGRRNPVVEAGLRRAGLLTAVGGGAAAVVGLRGGVRGLEVVLLALEEGRGGGGDPAGVRGAPVEQRRAFLLFKQLVFQTIFFHPFRCAGGT